jgi:hypothetical protein
MKALGLFILLFVLIASSAGLANDDVTASELARILGIHLWRVPTPPQGQLWDIEVVEAGAPPNDAKKLSSILGAASRAMISLRSFGGDEYEFFIDQGEGSSSGRFTPCRDPAGSSSICSPGYSISFHEDPVCLSDCAVFVVAELEPMVGGGPRKQVVIRMTPELVIDAVPGTTVVPLP